MAHQLLPSVSSHQESNRRAAETRLVEYEAQVHELQQVAADVVAKVDFLRETLAPTLGAAEARMTCESRVGLQCQCSTEIETIMTLWIDERKSHEVTKASLDRYTTLLEAADQAFLYVTSTRHDRPTELSLSEMASQALEAHFHAWDADHYSMLDDRLEAKRRKVKKASRELIHATRRYHRFAKSVQAELDLYSCWLEDKSANLQRNYERYCEIMAENCCPPLLLYEPEKHRKLTKAKGDFEMATQQREEAAKTCIRVAHLSGRPDILEDFYQL